MIWCSSSLCVCICVEQLEKTLTLYPVTFVPRWHRGRDSTAVSVELILLRPSSIVRCLYLIGLWLQCLFPRRVPNRPAGNRQYKHKARETLSSLDWETQNLSVNTQRHWLLISREFVKLGAITQVEVWPTSRGSDRFRNICLRLKHQTFHWQIV